MERTERKLADLQEWARFRNADGFMRLTFTDSGLVRLFCRKHVSVPADFIGCDHVEPCDCPDAGWIAEFQAGNIGEGCPVRLPHGAHVWVFALTFGDAVVKLHAAVVGGDVCECTRRALATGHPTNAGEG